MRILLVSAVLVCGCFSDVGPSIGDDGPAESGSEGEGSTVGMSSTSSTSVTTAGSNSGSASETSASSTASTTDHTDDTGPVDTGSESGDPACGMLGAACCGDSCDEGACHEGRCVVFAGAYAEPNTCPGCTTMDNGPNGEIPPPLLPYLGSCTCPDGFATSTALATTSDYCPQDGLLHTPTALRVCQLEELLPAADWTGAYVTSAAAGCVDAAQDGCVEPNPYTAACSCPGGESEIVAQTWAPCGGASDDRPLAIHVCVATDVEAISFGGAYQTRWTPVGQVECVAGNPRTAGECECPPGFDAEGLRITSPIVDNGGELFFCVPS